VPTQEKIESLEELKRRLGGVKAAVLAEYRGLSVHQLSELRKQLRAASATCRVVKNRIARLAVSDTALEGLAPHLKGPTALVLSSEDPVAVAKTLQSFAKTNPALSVKMGFVDGQVLAADGLKALADLPSREALRAQLVGLIEGPLARLVSLLQAAPRELAYVLAERGKGADADTVSQS
jgi:large subunit ribosomal protein L10